MKHLSMTVLVDNISRDDLGAEWGLSILIRADDKKILLDTGASGLFAENARKLGISLKDVDFGVLSHAHYDHSDGLPVFFEENRDAPVYLREGTAENCYGEQKDSPWHYIGIQRGVLDQFRDRFRYVEGTASPGRDIWLVPHKRRDYSRIALENGLYICPDGKRMPDDFAHEQSLVFDTENGLVIFNSCSHTGMKNIIEEVREAVGREKVYAYIGGLHLYLMRDEEILELAEYIRGAGMQYVLTGHCTGDHAFALLKEQLGDGAAQFCSGLAWEFV